MCIDCYNRPVSTPTRAESTELFVGLTPLHVWAKAPLYLAGRVLGHLHRNKFLL